MTKSKRKLVCFFFLASLCVSLYLGEQSTRRTGTREKNSKKDWWLFGCFVAGPKIL